MTEIRTHHIWIQPKPNIYLNITLISLVNIIGLAITIVFWEELNILYKSAILGSILLSIPFLLMYVMVLTISEDGFMFSLPHKKVKMQLTDIESARITKKMSNEYLEIRTSKPIGFRKRFQFQIEKNKNEVAEVLNDLINNGVKVYANSTLETQIKFNSETKKFEC